MYDEIKKIYAARKRVAEDGKKIQQKRPDM